MKNLGLGKLFINTGNTLIRQLLVAVLNLALVILLARGLGPEKNGLYAIVLLVSMLLSTFLNLGIAPANVYFIGRKSISVNSARRTTLQLWGILSIIGLVVAIIVLLGWGEQLFPAIPSYLLWIGVIIFPIKMLQSLLVALLQGRQDFWRYNFVLIIPAIATLIIALLTVLIFNWGVEGALLAFGMGQIIAFIVTWQAVDVHAKSDTTDDTLVGYPKQLLNYGWKAHLSNILAFINYRIDIFLVNFLLSPVAVGIYVVAVQFAERFWMLSQAVSTVLLPYLSELHHDEAKRKTLTPLVSRWILAISLIAAILVGLVVGPIINLVMGDQYNGAAEALYWFLPGIVLASFARVLANDIAARGRPELNMYTALLVVIFNLTANIILIPRMNINGAALATTLAYTANAIAKLFFYVRLSGNVWYRTIIFNYEDWELFKHGLRFFQKHMLAAIQG